MSNDEKTELNVEGLDKLAKAFKNVPEIRVGILGDGAARSPEEGSKTQLTNAQVGAFHEFGTSRTPQRSFLRVPLINNLDKRLKESGLFSRKSMDEAVKVGSLKPIVSKVGIVAEDVVLGAFATGGYGDWPALKPATLAQKKNHQILVETQQLRNSITSEIAESEEPE